MLNAQGNYNPKQLRHVVPAASSLSACAAVFSRELACPLIVTEKDVQTGTWQEP